MLSDPRYKTGVTLWAVADSMTNAIGERRILPAANHDSLSATQKSESVCDAIANLSVITTSFSTVYGMECSVKYFVTISLLPVVVWTAVVCNSESVSSTSSSSSKSKSVNTGTSSMIFSVSLMSKSVGIGISDSVTVLSGVSMVGLLAFFVTLLKSNTDVCLYAVLSRARSYATRISAGTAAGMGSGFDSVFVESVSDFVSVSGVDSDSVFVSDSDLVSISGSSSIGVWVNAFVKNVFTHSGNVNLKLNSGDFVRAITIVVATYNGTMAKIKMPNTNPANPCRCACIN